MPRIRIRIGGEDWLLAGPSDVLRLQSAHQAQRILEADPTAAEELFRKLAISHDDTGFTEQDQLTRLAGVLARSEALLVRLDDFRALDAPSVVPLLPPEEPLPVSPKRPVPTSPEGPDTPLTHFIDIIVVGEDLTPPTTGDLELRADGRIRLPWTPINNDKGVFQFVPESSQLLATLRTLSWWKDTSLPAEPTPPVELVEFEDLLFSFNSLVLLPTAGIDPDAPRPELRMFGLGAITAVLRRLAEQPAKLLIAGHTDTLGSAEYNDTLSRERAENVLAVLKGDREAWAAACAVKHYKVDWKTILRWVHDAFGWDCDPGRIDELATEQSSHALESFRLRHAAEAGTEPPTGEICQADWAAFFDMYELALAKALGHEDVADLAERRNTLQFTEPPVLACGERWPRAEPNLDDYASDVNRRVDLWLFREDLPDLGRQPLGADLYGDDARFGPRYIPITPETPDQGFEIAVMDDRHAPLPGATVRVLRNDAVVATLRTNAGGHVWIRPPGRCDVELDGFDVELGYGGPLPLEAEDDKDPHDPDLPRTVTRTSLDGDRPALLIAYPTEPPLLPTPTDAPVSPTSPPEPDPTSPYGPGNPYRYERLSQDGLTGEEFALKQRTYVAHVKKAAAERPFVDDIPSSDLAPVGDPSLGDSSKHRMRKSAAAKVNELLRAARAEWASAKANGEEGAVQTSSIGICSTLRSASTQFSSWDSKFAKYLGQYRQTLDDPNVPCNEIDAPKLAKYIGGKLAAPGYSLHQDGRAIDFMTIYEGKRLEADSSVKAVWMSSWFFYWLHNHATARFGLVPYEKEPWHWSYPG